MEIYSVRDNKTGILNVPQFFRNLVEAKRSFITVARDERTMISKFPADYDLMQLGTFDETTGKWSIHEQPEHIMTAKNAQEVEK